ncbi:MAG: response regulator [Bacillota bacterium]
MPRRILVVDDEPTIREVVADVLQMDGYEVITAADGPQAVETARRTLPHLIILDLMLPGMDGFDVVRRIRAESSVPIIILSVRESDVDKIRGFQLQVDDYVTKPFSPLELLMRVKAVLRRSSQLPREEEGAQQLAFGSLTLDRTTRRVYRDGTPIPLTAAEFNVLWALATHPEQVLTREQLADQGWGHEEYAGPESVTVLISRIRNKLEEEPANPRLIQTVRGVGYRFQP